MSGTLADFHKLSGTFEAGHASYVGPGRRRGARSDGHIRRQRRKVPVPSTGVAALRVSEWFTQGSISRGAT